MAMILWNSSDLLRVDLKGVNVILPDLVLALEAVLGDQVDKVEILEFEGSNWAEFCIDSGAILDIDILLNGQRILNI